jgi:hypothetical protein
VGHPSGNRRMFKCAGVIFDDAMRDGRWTVRIYHATDEWSQTMVWCFAKRRVSVRGIHSGFHPNDVVPECDVEQAVYDFAWTELARLRLTGAVQS